MVADVIPEFRGRKQYPDHVHRFRMKGHCHYDGRTVLRCTLCGMRRRVGKSATAIRRDEIAAMLADNTRSIRQIAIDLDVSKTTVMRTKTLLRAGLM
jgi:hypothetical protein